jgi:hypothetical protein
MRSVGRGSRTGCWSRTWAGNGCAAAAAAANRPAVARLEAAMRKAEAVVLTQEGVEVGLLVKEFFDGPVEAVLQRMAGPGGRRPAAEEARGAARRARAAGAAGGGAG